MGCILTSSLCFVVKFRGDQFSIQATNYCKLWGWSLVEATCGSSSTISPDFQVQLLSLWVYINKISLMWGNLIFWLSRAQLESPSELQLVIMFIVHNDP